MKKTVELSQNQEYRFEVSEHQKFKVMVKKGLAEIKALELINEKWYSFSDIKTSIFTFTGCEIEVEGDSDLDFVSKNSTFPGIFTFFDKMREEQNNVLVLGKGRTTFSISVCNYFTRIHKEI